MNAKKRSTVSTPPSSPQQPNQDTSAPQLNILQGQPNQTQLLTGFQGDGSNGSNGSSQSNGEMLSMLLNTLPNPQISFPGGPALPGSLQQMDSAQARAVASLSLQQQPFLSNMLAVPANQSLFPFHQYQMIQPGGAAAAMRGNLLSHQPSAPTAFQPNGRAQISGFSVSQAPLVAAAATNLMSHRARSNTSPVHPLGTSEEFLRSSSSTKAVGVGKPSASLSNDVPNKKPRAKVLKSADKPKRPLSAYNLFFQEERARLLQELEDKHQEPEAPTAAGKSKKKKKKKKLSIPFSDLAKMVSARWKIINPAETARYKEKAAMDLKRYKAELEAYNQKRQDNLEKTREALEATVDEETKRRYFENFE